MKGQAQEKKIPTVMCKQHKQKCLFVCLHKTCSHAFKVGCSKCRRDHGQHPNRLINIGDFHAMLAKPIRYLQTSTAYNLMNLKKKIQYIRNFRTSILEKQIQLIDSNQNIKATIATILEQHYRIRSVVAHLHPETLQHHFQDYVDYLQKCRQFMAFNPVKGDLVFNNQIIKTSRVSLEKHLKVSHQLTDSIRQFLVKIIEVLLANCAHQEDDDDIEFDNEGDNPLTFNIIIKNRTDVMDVPNIKNKLQNQGFLEMFDEEKDALNQQIDMLQKQLDFKVNILNRIKSNTQRKSSSFYQEQFEKLSSVQPDQPYSQTASSLCQKDKHNTQILSLKEQYQTILTNKEQFIQQLKETCQQLQAKIVNISQEQSSQDKKSVIQSDKYHKLEEKLIQKDKDINSLKEKIEELELSIKGFQQSLEEKTTSNDKKAQQLKEIQTKLQQYVQTIEQKQNIIDNFNKTIEQQVKTISEYTQKQQIKEMQNQALKNELQTLEANSELKVCQQEQRDNDILRKQSQQFENQAIQLLEEIQKKDHEIAKHKKKYGQLQKLIDKMNENKGQSQKEVMKLRNQIQQRQKMMMTEQQNRHSQIDGFNQKLIQQREKVKELEESLQKVNEKLKDKTDQLREKERKLITKEDIIKEQETEIFKSKEYQTQLIELKKILQKELKNKEQSNKTDRDESQVREQIRAQVTLKIQEEQNKKMKQMKEMLELSIKNNQQLKDKNYQLELDLTNYNSHQKKTNTSIKNDSNGRKIFVQQIQTKGQIAQLSTVQSHFIDIPSPTFKKKGNQTKQRKPLNKEQKKQTYQQVRNLFRLVSSDVGILEERLKDNAVIQKIYLKELQRKRLQNKNLKKQVENYKLCGGTYKHTEVHKASSPAHKAQRDKHEKKAYLNSPVPTKETPSESQVSIVSKKYSSKVNK